MSLIFLSIVQVALGQGPEPEHAANPVYQTVRKEARDGTGALTPLPPPLLHDGRTAEAQRAALRGVAESDDAVDELLRNSVTAPFKLKLRNVESRDGTVRVVDLWFVVYASLDELDLDALNNVQAPKSGSTEVGNMRFEGRLLTDAELAKRKLRPEQKYDRYSHARSLLLDRIRVEATNRTVVTRSKESLVVATQTVAAFDNDPEFPNRWRKVEQQAGRERLGPPQAYAGGWSYAKVSRLAIRPGALFIEVHGAFDEPKAWFDGAPILRSKISLVAQDQVRRLRRAIAKDRKPAPRG